MEEKDVNHERKILERLDIISNKLRERGYLSIADKIDERLINNAKNVCLVNKRQSNSKEKR